MVNTRAWPAILLFLALPVHADPVLLINGDFESDRGAFTIPTGWVPFGVGKYEGVLADSWKAQIADVHAEHTTGLYQVAPNVVPGTHYRLTADGRAGRAMLPVRIGLAPSGSIAKDRITWSQSCASETWTPLSVEVAAQSDRMVVILQMRNRHKQYQLLEAGAFDNVRLDAVDVGTPPPTVRPAIPTIPPPNDVFANLANLWSLAYPKPGVRTFLAGTHDPDPNGNADFDRVEGHVVRDDGPWTVLETFRGPGAIVRIWMTNFARPGRIRIEVDDNKVIDTRLVDFFGNASVSGWPLINQTSGAWVSYWPIPFARSARVLVKEAEQGRFYWQITAQSFEEATGLRPFASPLNDVDADALQRARDQWACATMNPKPDWPGTREVSKTTTLAPGQSQVVWSQPGAGMIDEFRIDVPKWDESALRNLTVRITWDSENSPQVEAPAGLLFGLGYRPGICRGLLTGVVPKVGGYCYFPMPFAQSARIELHNTATEAIDSIQCTVRWVPLDPKRVSPMRFHAFWKQEARAGERRLFVPLETSGAGHFVGLIADMACGEVKDTHFLEGDEYIWVDGESEPSTAGTGTEDYFSCGWYFNAGPITLPVVGAPLIDRLACRLTAYRLHVPDVVPFDRSFKLGFEVGDSVASPEWGRYETLAFFYLHHP